MTVSANFPGRPFALQADAIMTRQDIPGNRSEFFGWAKIHKNSSSPTYSNNPGSSWSIYSRGAPLAGASGLRFDFRNGTDFPLWEGYWWITHNPDGSFPGGALDVYANYDLLGATEVHQPIDAPRIPRGPRVMSGGVWHHSIAYVYNGGVWRIAIPYVYNGGVWRLGGN